MRAFELKSKSQVHAGMTIRGVEHYGETTVTYEGRVVKVETRSEGGWEVWYAELEGCPFYERPLEVLQAVTKVELYELKPDLPTTTGSVVRVGTRAAFLDDEHQWVWCDDAYDRLGDDDLRNAEVLHVAGHLPS